MDDLNQWLTLIANFAVIGGLIFLALEVRHNTNVSQAQIHTELLSLGHETHNWKRDQQFADIVVRAGENYSALSPAEKAQFDTFVFQFFNVWEHAHGTFRRGLMSASYWEAWDAHFRPQMSDKSWLGVWTVAKPHFAAEFQDHVDSYIPSAR